MLLAVSCLPLSAQSASTRRYAEKITQALKLIETRYVDTVDMDRAVDRMLEQLVRELDPHSVYVPASGVEAANEPMEGFFEGVGIEFALIADTLTVQAVLSGGPAEAVGMYAGDKIIAVDGEGIAGVGLTVDGVRSRLRGPRGSRVTITVQRRDGVRDFTLRRAKIPLASVEAAYEPEPGTFYLKLSRFSKNTIEEVVDAFGRNASQRPERILLDLRGNGGGFMNVAVSLADLFLEKGQLIVRTEGRGILQEDRASGLGVFSRVPLAILVDENSASASEILAGALQDWDRAVIVGRRTFGKGLVQQQYELNDGSAIRLTVARYHTPSGRVVQAPYKPGQRDAYYQEFLNRYDRGESFSLDSIPLPDSLRFKTLRLGRTVYGGGGILPDIFVPYDTTGVTRFSLQVIGRGLLTDYVNDYIDLHRDTLDVPDMAAFDAVYAGLEPDAYAGLLAYCAEKGVSPADEAEASESAPLLKTRLKALLSRSPLGSSGYWQIVNRESPEYQRALEAVNAR